MGIGNILVKGEDVFDVDHYASQYADDRDWPHVGTPLRIEGDQFLTILYGDCLVTYECDRCMDLMCVGCGNHMVHDVDTGERTCTECLGHSLWEHIVQLQKGAPCV